MKRSSKMKNTALFVNVGRGPIVDTDALINALKTGNRLCRARCYGSEPLPADHPLLEGRKLPHHYHILVLIQIELVMICLF